MTFEQFTAWLNIVIGGNTVREYLQATTTLAGFIVVFSCGKGFIHGKF